MALENTTPERIEELVRKQRAFFATGTTRDIEWRRFQLREFRNGLQRWEKPLCDALWKDLHKSYEEAYMTEIGLVYGEIREATSKVGRWARKRWKPTSLAVLPSSSYIVREPLGSTLILSPWNYPVQLLLNPLVGAIAAGCTAILKPSPYVPNVSKVLEDMISDIFEEDFVAVVQGNRTVNSELFKHRYDLVFLTGSPSLGRIAMEAQAKYLTPMVLELGGKSPCIVDKDADLKIAARRIAWGKSLNSGQTCIAPDYLFLHEDIKDAFIDAFKKELASLYPDGTEQSDFFVHIVKDSAFDRLVGYLKDGEIVAGGHSDREKRWIEPTLLDKVSPDAGRNLRTHLPDHDFPQPRRGHRLCQWPREAAGILLFRKSVEWMGYHRQDHFRRCVHQRHDHAHRQREHPVRRRGQFRHGQLSLRALFPGFQPRARCREVAHLDRPRVPLHALQAVLAD